MRCLQKARSPCSRLSQEEISSAYALPGVHPSRLTSHPFKHQHPRHQFLRPPFCLVSRTSTTFGWPVGYGAANIPVSSHHNHGSALSSLQTIKSFLDSECHLGATCGPFITNPLCVDLINSPLHIAHSRSGKPRVVVDLSFPPGFSVNSGIPSDTYLSKPFVLRLAGIDALVDIIRSKGTGCHFFKKDLSRAYRQLRIDPHDAHLLGFHHNHLYIDLAPPFGLHSLAMMCQRTTNTVSYLYKTLDLSCTNYIDDFGGAETPDMSTQAFNALGDLFTSLGLQSSPNKDCPPTTSMVFLGVQLNTLAMSMSVTPERLQELHHHCSSSLSSTRISCHDLQSLLGVDVFCHRMRLPCPCLHVQSSQHPPPVPTLAFVLSFRGQQVRPPLVVSLPSTLQRRVASQLLSSQFSAWRRYIRLSIWCAGTCNQTPR